MRDILEEKVIWMIINAVDYAGNDKNILRVGNFHVSYKLCRKFADMSINFIESFSIHVLTYIYSLCELSCFSDKIYSMIKTAKAILLGVNKFSLIDKS